MALRNIVKTGDEILHKKSRTVDKFDERLATLIDDMIATMRDVNGVGLAAVQVGVLRRVAVIEVVKGEVIELVNPVFTEKSTDEECGLEGCLSFPDQQEAVYRPQKVKIKAQDRNGNYVEYEGEGFTARAFCHELDHLDGITFDQIALTDEELEKWTEEQASIEFDDDEFYEDEDSAVEE